MSLGVVIPAWNAERTLGDQLLALVDQERVDEVVVADNGSTDRTRAVAQSHGARVVDASRRRGAASARNVGAQALNTDIIGFCDADDVVSKGWADAVVAAIGAGGDLVGGPLEVAGVATKPPRLNDPFLPAVPTANLAVTREAFSVAGGFDERYRTSEDTDFCWRVQQLGFRFFYSNDMVVRYSLRSSVIGSAKQRYVHGWSDVLLVKNFDLTHERHVVTPRSFASAIVRLPAMAVSPIARSNWINWWSYVAGRVAGSLTHRHFAV